MSTFKDLDNLLQKFVDDGLPGCGMLICKKGEVITEILDPLDGRFDWKARVLFFYIRKHNNANDTDNDINGIVH